MKNFNLNLYSAALVLGSALTLTACGPQAYAPGNNQLSLTAGQQNLPPKIDILIGIDVKGAMKNIYPQMNSQINTFTTNLQNSGWDYRLTAVSLSENDPMPMTQIAVSDYDGNWFSLGSWLAPYPGAAPSTEQIGSSYFSQGTTAATFFPSSLNAYGNDGHKTGILNEVTFLSRSDVTAHFLRPDATLAIITLSDSQDTSGGSWVNAPITLDPEWQAPVPDNLPTFVNDLIALKGNINMVKYYAVVSIYAHNDGSCMGSNTFAGTRYVDMANQLNGLGIDICTNPFPIALTQIQSDLTTTQLSFEKNYLVIGNEPNPATITVTENGATIPQDSKNGWEYVGYLTYQPTIFYPVAMDNATGYMIKLNGSAVLVGNQTAVVNYENAGAVVAH